MASDFPAFVAYHHEHYDVGSYAIDSANAGKAGSLCFLNTGDNEVEECGADPALILGLMTGPYSARTIYPGGKMPVIVLDQNVVVGMCSATTPADSHLTDLFGVVKLASGNWAVDIGDTSAVKVQVVRHDIAAGIFYVKFLPASLQSDADAS
jgi:hypothetical protein